jgi:hypothetical protein
MSNFNHKNEDYKNTVKPQFFTSAGTISRGSDRGRWKIQNFKIIHSENMWLAYNKRLQQGI